MGGKVEMAVKGATGASGYYCSLYVRVSGCGRVGMIVGMGVGGDVGVSLQAHACMWLCW